MLAGVIGRHVGADGEELPGVGPGGDVAEETFEGGCGGPAEQQRCAGGEE